MDRLAATLIFAGWDRTSAKRRKVPLTTVAWHRPRHSLFGDRSCSGGVPARRTNRVHLLGRSRDGGDQVTVPWVGSGGHLGPQEPGELPGGRGRHDALDVLAGGQCAEPGAQALLGYPRPGGDLRWQALLTAGDLHADGGAGVGGPRPPQ